MDLLYTCPICHSDRIDPYSMKYLKGFPHLSRTKCRDCKIVFANPVASYEELTAFYSHYYDKGNFGALSYKERVTDNINSILNEDETILKKKKKTILTNIGSGKFLDIGCGLGEEMAIYQQLGFSVFGTELDPDCIQFIKERLPQAQIFNGDLIQAAYANESFDVVNIYHVIEHLINPILYIKEIHRILKKNGMVIIGTPNIDSLAYTLFRKINFLSFSIPSIVDGLEHTVVFNKKNLRHCLESNGFEVIQHFDESLQSSFSEIWSSNLSVKKKIVRYIQTFFSLNQVIMARKIEKK